MMSKYFASFASDQAGYGFMWILTFLFVFVLAIVVERGYFVLVRSNINAPKFFAEIRRLVQAGDNKKALALCRSAGHRALAQVFARAIEVTVDKDIVDFRSVQNAVDEATLEIIPKLSSRTNYLATLANVSVLLGLMGTIYGLVLAFASVGTDSEALGQGISAAMLTTFGGLINAIPAIIFYSMINTKTSAIIDDIDEYSVKLIHLLTERR
jgi:biopolymer transport protein ExbB/TolQ